MQSFIDGPSTTAFTPLALGGNTIIPGLTRLPISSGMRDALPHAPAGRCVGWGIPFTIDSVVAIHDHAVEVPIGPSTAQWLVFLHTSDGRPPEERIDAAGGGEPDGPIEPRRFIRASTGRGHLAEHAADYVICFADGAEERIEVRRLHQVGGFYPAILDKCFEAVGAHKPYTREPTYRHASTQWGMSQWRIEQPDFLQPWTSWLWAWENPRPDTPITAIRFEPKSGLLVVSAISAGDVTSHPLRWRTRRKAILRLADGAEFDDTFDDSGLLRDIRIDMGQIISARPRLIYDDEHWTQPGVDVIPKASTNEILIEYTSHPGAEFHLLDGSRVAVADLESNGSSGPLTAVAPADQLVQVRVVEREGDRPVPARLHLHGQVGEYLAPVDRHRYANPMWYEDPGTEVVLLDHSCAYTGGVATARVPLGEVFIEVTKGFEFRPARLVAEVTAGTDVITIELERVHAWRQKGWITADTHVHTLSPDTARLAGAAEGVNVVNLLASQWGEWLTNVGDFDGRAFYGVAPAGPDLPGDADCLVRVGTENRQHVLGHISLLGYDGPLITPLCTSGPDESALGDPVEVLLTDWAQQCRRQGGLVVIPHFAMPRAEAAACIVAGLADAAEMVCDPFPHAARYGGMESYALSDWYRYLNCGYRLPVVGGTDKESATTTIGQVRTYARVGHDGSFTFQEWMDAIRRGETFATFGPLVEFSVDSKPIGSCIDIAASGTTVEVVWRVASTTIPMSRVELVVSGAVVRGEPVAQWEQSGTWHVEVDESCWVALVVLGHYEGKPEVILAHTSPIVITVDRLPLFSMPDAMTILDQIEGSLIYLDSVAIRPDMATHARMVATLEGARKKLKERIDRVPGG